MMLQPVNSSSLAAVGYDLDSQILTIEFRHGGIYDYLDVPDSVYEELMDADSHGDYFVRNIRDHYRYVRR